MLSNKIILPQRALLAVLAWLRPFLIPVAAIMALTVAFFGNSFWGSQKTFIVDALVSGASITFNGNHNSWYLGEATVCTPTKSRQRADKRTATDEICDPMVYETRFEQEFLIRWPDGASGQMRIGESGRIEFYILQDLPKLPKKSLVILPTDFFTSQGALSFSGSATFGKTINSGTKSILLDGSYKVREDHVVSSLLGKQTYEVASSELTRGDQVRVVDGQNLKNAALGYGHISRALDVDGAVRLVFQSSPGDFALEIASFGMDEPAILKPDWIDSTLASPYVLIVGLFISLVISVLELHSFTRKN